MRASLFCPARIKYSVRNLAPSPLEKAVKLSDAAADAVINECACKRMHGTSATLPLPSARSSVEARSEVVIYLPLWLAHQEQPGEGAGRCRGRAIPHLPRRAISRR